MIRLVVAGYRSSTPVIIRLSFYSQSSEILIVWGKTWPGIPDSVFVSPHLKVRFEDNKGNSDSLISLSLKRIHRKLYILQVETVRQHVKRTLKPYTTENINVVPVVITQGAGSIKQKRLMFAIPEVSWLEAAILCQLRHSMRRMITPGLSQLLIERTIR